MVERNFSELRPFFIALLIIVASSFPYIHDMISARDGSISGWVPNFGIAALITDAEGYVLGFSSYRVFLYMLFMQLFAHLGWLGWFFSAKGKAYRFALLVPVGLSLYSICLILFNLRNTNFNEPSVKFGITIGLSLLLIVNFFFNNTSSKTS